VPSPGWRWQPDDRFSTATAVDSVFTSPPSRRSLGGAGRPAGLAATAIVLKATLAVTDGRDPKTSAFAREPRHPIRMPLRYRASSDPQWREGHTENISRSGVLFRTDHPMPLQTPIEMLLALPVEIVGAGAAATVICRRRILRTEEPRTGSTGGARPAVAATVAAYRLAHFQGNEPRRI
jgi:hypothetical protein